MAPSGATLTPGSVTLAPGIATGVMNGPDAPAPVVPTSPPSGDAASITRVARQAFLIQGFRTDGERPSVRILTPNFLGSVGSLRPEAVSYGCLARRGGHNRPSGLFLPVGGIATLGALRTGFPT